MFGFSFTNHPTLQHIAVLDFLISNGIFVRMPFTSPENRCIRVSAGTDKDLKLFEEKFPLALSNAKKKLNLK